MLSPFDETFTSFFSLSYGDTFFLGAGLLSCATTSVLAFFFFLVFEAGDAAAQVTGTSITAASIGIMMFLNLIR